MDEQEKNQAQEQEQAQTQEQPVEQTEAPEVPAETEVEAEEESDSEDQEMSFEELLKQSEAAELKRVQTGQKLNGHVVMISGDAAFIDIGMRSEAVLPLENPEEPGFSEGDEIEVYVTNAKGQVQLGLEPVLGFGDFTQLVEAEQSGGSIVGKVGKVIPGGYEINVSGVRCFCPHSQINIRPVKNPEEMVSQEFEFKVIELDQRSKNVVLSRRALMEAEREAQLAVTREKLVVGESITGTVADIQSFGAFVDLGGIQGLVHISELAYQQVGRVEDVLSLGDEITVKILDISRDKRGKERISLSLKAMLPNPWDVLGFNEGDTIQGKVVRKSDFGIFINVSSGIDGLLPRRLMKQAGKMVEMDQYEIGEGIEVEVVEIDRQGRKIALALPGWNEELRSSIQVGEELDAEVIKVLPVGVLVQGVDDPAKGLIHKRTLRMGSMKQVADAFPPGKRIRVVLEDRDSQGRYNFTLKQASETVDGQTIAEFTGQQEDLGHNPFASFFNKD